MKKQIKILIVGIILLSTVFLSGCTQSVTETINPPNMMITGQYKREVYEGADRVGYVDITVKNTGGSGSKNVYVRVSQGSNQWTKDKSVYLSDGESKDISFRFSEIEFWTMDTWSFTAWIN